MMTPGKVVYNATGEVRTPTMEDFGVSREAVERTKSAHRTRVMVDIASLSDDDEDGEDGELDTQILTAQYRAKLYFSFLFIFRSVSSFYRSFQDARDGRAASPRSRSRIAELAL